MLFAAAGLVVAPLASLAIIAFRGEPALSLGLAASVLPAALLETALLLAGVALLTGIVGVGTAWLVTVHRFPGRDWLAWLLPLPLAVPTYITAYVYVEVFDAAGPVQAALRQAMGWRSRTEYWFPEIRSLPGCILVMAVVLYPYVYAAARTMFATQSASMVEVARTLGAGRFEMFRTVALPLARPALAIGLALALLEALNDIGASEYLGVRTLTVSVYTTWLNRGSLAGAAQIACLMLAIVVALIALERRGRRDRRYAVSTGVRAWSRRHRCRAAPGSSRRSLARSRSPPASSFRPASFSRKRSGAGSSASSTPPSSGISRERSASRSRRRSERSFSVSW